MRDWNSGKIPYYTIPPAEAPANVHVSSTVVSSWGKEFDWNSLDSILDENAENQNTQGLVAMVWIHRYDLTFIGVR